MRILLPTSEAAPLYKIGGLGDVAGSLPIALKQLNHDIRLVLPKYPQIEINPQHWQPVHQFDVIYKHQIHQVQVLQGTLPLTKNHHQTTGAIVYLFDEPQYLAQNYQENKNVIDQFAFFSQAITTWLSEHITPWQPQIIHLHDWHVALIPLLLRQKYPQAAKTYRTLLTIHNLAHQGITPANIVNKLQLDPSQCQALAWDLQNGDVDILMEGIIHADLVNTVSPTYAQEILTKEHGVTLEPVLQSLQGKLSGILNGVDPQKWNPQTDKELVQNYTVDNWLTGKQANKIAIQKQAGLPENPDATLLGFIGRLDPIQKGVNLILQAIQSGLLNHDTQQHHDQPQAENNHTTIPPHHHTTNLQFILLGTGDPQLETQLKQAAEQNPNFSAQIKFDVQLARRIYAGCDFILIPSKFEPCGLIQLIAMRYGTIPIARTTGGLADTIQEEQTGFLFPDYTSQSLMQAVNKALNYYQDFHQRSQLVTNCMNQDFSWKSSAEKYVTLYEKLLTA